jgi:hypothetical protein
MTDDLSGMTRDRIDAGRGELMSLERATIEDSDRRSQVGVETEQQQRVLRDEDAGVGGRVSTGTGEPNSRASKGSDV